MPETTRDPRIDPKRDDITNVRGHRYLVISNDGDTVTFVELRCNGTVETLTLDEWRRESASDTVIRVGTP